MHPLQIETATLGVSPALLQSKDEIWWNSCGLDVKEYIEMRLKEDITPDVAFNQIKDLVFSAQIQAATLGVSLALLQFNNDTWWDRCGPDVKKYIEMSLEKGITPDVAFNQIKDLVHIEQIEAVTLGVSLELLLSQNEEQWWDGLGAYVLDHIEMSLEKGITPDVAFNQIKDKLSPLKIDATTLRGPAPSLTPYEPEFRDGAFLSNQATTKKPGHSSMRE